MGAVELPNRTLFKPTEVCQIAGIQPFVLRTWEAEFPELGLSPRDGGPRLYRRADVERVLAIKQLVFEEGLTVAGARRRLGEGSRSPDGQDASLAELVGRDVRERLQQVRDGLRELLRWLTRPAPGAGARPAAGLTTETARPARQERGRPRPGPGRWRREAREALRGKKGGGRARR